MKKINTLLEIDLMKLAEYPELKQIIEEVQTDYQKAENKEMYVEISKQSIDDIVDMISQVAPDAFPQKEGKQKAATSSAAKKTPAKSNKVSISEKEKALTKALEDCQKENQDKTVSPNKKQKPTKVDSSTKQQKVADKNKSATKVNTKKTEQNQNMKMDEELAKDQIEQHLLAIIKIPGLKPLTTSTKGEQLKTITMTYFNELLPALGLKGLKRDKQTFEKQIDELLEKHGATKIKQLASQWKGEFPEIDFIEKNERKFYSQRLNEESKNILSILKKANSLLAQNMAGAAAEHLAEHLSADQIDVYLPAYIKELF